MLAIATYKQIADHGVDGLFMWGSGSRECGATWLCAGAFNCAPHLEQLELAVGHL
jgi:hypothetical protein